MPAGRRVMLRMCSEPVEVGYKPEMIVVRAGAQTGAFDQTLRISQSARRKPVEVRRRGVACRRTHPGEDPCLRRSARGC